MNKLLLAGFLTMILIFAGCASTGGGAGGASGSAEASAMGFGGDVTVKVTLEKGKITAVEASGSGETDGIGSRAITLLPAQMVSANSFDVDAVAGASITSAAIIEAAKAAAAQIQ